MFLGIKPKVKVPFAFGRRGKGGPGRLKERAHLLKELFFGFGQV
jgi:hypothetical protein